MISRTEVVGVVSYSKRNASEVGNIGTPGKVVPDMCPPDHPARGMSPSFPATLPKQEYLATDGGSALSSLGPTLIAFYLV